MLAVIGLAAAVVALVVTGTLSPGRQGPAMTGGAVTRSLPQTSQPAVPRPLHGVPLAGSTGLRLLVSADPPFVLTTRAVRIATGWQVASAKGGRAIWLLRYADPHHCTLSEIGLDGRARQRAWQAPVGLAGDLREGTILQIAVQPIVAAPASRSAL